MAFRQRCFLFVFFVTSFCNGVIAVQVEKCENKGIEFNMQEDTDPKTIIQSVGFSCSIQSVTILNFKPDEYINPYFAISNEAINATFSMITIILSKSFDLLDKPNTAKNFWAGMCSVTTKEGRTFSLTTRITVNDVNTQPPTFRDSLYEYKIPETFPENVIFTNIYGRPMVAYDYDYEKSNNHIKFELLENLSNSNIFKVVSERTTSDSRDFTVNLQLQKKLDFFESSKHSLTLIAKDKDYETNVSVIIYVQSEKKPTPKFERSKYHVNTNATQMKEGTIKIDPPIKATACYPHNEGCCEVKYKIDIDASDESAAKFQIDENAENISILNIKENPITNPYIETVIVVVLKAYLEEAENQYSQVNLRIDVEPEMQTTLATTTEAESSSEATTTPLSTTIISSTADDNEITTTAANSIDSTTASGKATTITSTSTTDSTITTKNTITDQTTKSEEITTSNQSTKTVFSSTAIQITEDHISTTDSSVTDITGSSDETTNTAEYSQTPSIITSSDSPVTTSSDSPVTTSSDSPVTTSSDSPVTTSSDSPVTTSSDSPFTTSSDSPVTTSSDSSVTTSSTTTSELTEEVRFPYDIYNVTVPNITYNTLVWTVSANPCASYKLTNNLFQIDNITGDIIFIGNSLEHGKEIILEIEAYPYWNNSFLADTAQVIITVNFNMNKGIGFSQPYYKFSIKENKLGKIEQSSAELRVRDKNVSYEITNCGDSSTKFSIDSTTAMLSANVTFDYEVRSQYQLKIRFVEIGDTKTDCEHIDINEAVVVINIEDVNEPPNFAKSNYPILGITPSTIEGSLLTSLKAEDQDGGDNGKLRFSLNQSSSSFDLDADGLLYLKQSSEEIWISLTAVVSDCGIPSLEAKKNFQVIYVKTDEIFILTIQRRKNTTKKSKRNLLSQELQETSIEEAYDNSENPAEFLEKLSQIIHVHIGFIPQEMNELSDRIEFYLFALDNNMTRKLTFEEIKEKFASHLAVNIKPKLKKQQDVKTEYEMTVIIILAVILAAIVVGLVGIFIFKKWSQGKGDLGTDGTETKEVSLADSIEGETRTNQKDNPLYNGSENTNEEYAITLPELTNENSHQSENGNLIQNSIHIKSNNIASNNESNNAKETNNTVDENTKNKQKNQTGNDHVGIYPKLSPMFAKLSDPDAMFTEPEPLEDYYQVDIPPEDYESNNDLYENKNCHYNPDNMLENEILVNDSDITSQNETIPKNNSLLKDLHNDRNNDNTVFYKEDDVQPNVIETNDSPKQTSSQKYSLTNETTEDLENNQTENEFADDSMEEDKKNRNKRKSIVTFNEIPEVINLPSEEISSL